MEFDEEERYACAALFTLALHQTQVEAGNDAGDVAEPSAWGQPLDDGELAGAAAGAQAADVAAAEWAAFWGWDCCGPAGLLEQLYTALGVPQRSWAGLKRLPELGGGHRPRQRQHRDLVSSYIKVLDPNLAALSSDAVKAAGPTADQPPQPPGVEQALRQAEALAREASGGSDMGGGGGDAPTRMQAAFLEGVASDSDSDLEHDLASAHLARRILQHSAGGSREVPAVAGVLADTAGEPTLGAAAAPEPADQEAAAAAPAGQEAAAASEAAAAAAAREPAGEQPPAEAGAGAAERRRSYSKAEALSDALQRWQLEGAEPASPSAAQQQRRQQGGREASGSLRSDDSSSSLSQAAASAKALAAVWVLLEACITHAEQAAAAEAALQQQRPAAAGTAERQPAAEEPQEQEREGLLADEPQPGPATVGGVPPTVRWYDARARQGLRTVARWLRVPWRQVLNCETLLVRRLLLPLAEGRAAAASPWERSIRAAKIGAATLTIGALFALTGGVAAPAIAGGVGAAIGLAGGSAAVATGVSGFLGTAAGGAVIASTVGAAGIGLTAPHVANRIGNVREFGFLCLSEDLLERLAAAEAALAAAAAAAADSAAEAAAAEASAGPASRAASGELQRRRRGASPEGRLKPGRQAPKGLEMVELRPPREGLQPPSAEGRQAGAEPAAAEAGGAGAARGEAGGPTAAEQRLGDGAASSPVDSGHITFAAGSSSGGGAAALAAQRAAAAAAKAKPAAAALVRPQPVVAAASSGSGGKKPGKAVAAPSDKAEASRWLRKKVAEAPLLPAPVPPARRVDDMRMSLTIGVSGWISQREDFQRQWLDLARRQRSSEVFSLVWESKELAELNTALVAFAASQAGQEAAKWVLTHFFFTGLVAALAWPALIYSAVQLIDTAWSVALQRAQLAGRLLAHVLAGGAHGGRPVVLVGFSMGARLVFHCLLELCRLKAKGIVEHACLLGTPVALRPERWAMARSVVAGRLINGFSRKDWLLAVVYRGTNGFIKEAAGLAPVPFAGVENVNLSSLIQGHFDYIEKAPEVLDLLNVFD